MIKLSQTIFFFIIIMASLLSNYNTTFEIQEKKNIKFRLEMKRNAEKISFFETSKL